MQLKIFKNFIKEVYKEGNRLQKVDINGKQHTKRYFTHTQLLSLVVAGSTLFLLPKGFSDNFAGYIISFLSIFIGLFTSIVISMFDKSKGLFQDYERKSPDEQANIKKTRNYLVQFTGLTSYSIFLAILLIVLLTMVLVHDKFKVDISNYHLIFSFQGWNKDSILLFIKVTILCLHRFLIVYLLLNFFTITMYSTTSYFSFLLSEYKNLIKNND